MKEEKKLKARLKKLKALIKAHDHHYYNMDSPRICDYEYDRLFNELTALEQKRPDWITADSPTQRVPGKALLSFEKAFHKKAMLSLQNTYNEEEIVSFYEKTLKTLTSKQVEFLLEPKLDGVAVNLLYEKGRLSTALTRGDGMQGENVTANIKTLRSIPWLLPITAETLEIRGEVILLKKDFQKINREQKQKGLSLFANPRNMSAGSLRRLDPSLTAKRPLKFFTHSLGFFKGLQLKSQSEFLQKARELGLPAFPVMELKAFFSSHNKKKPVPASVFCRTKEDILKYFRFMEKSKSLWPFETDGIVLKVNSFSEQEKMGEISRFPRYAKAGKFAPETGQTTVKDIVIQVGRTGALTPVAVFKPVKVGGVRISQATLHSPMETAKKDVRVGDTVTVGRAGDVIPEVIEVHFSKRLSDCRAFKIPEYCPACASAVKKTGEMIFCVNSFCPAVKLQSLIHFASKKAMNIESLGSKMMEKLYTEKHIQNFSDIYRLTKEKLMTLQGMGEKSCHRLLQNIEKSKQVRLSAFIFALGIRHIGESNARELSDFFTNLENTAPLQTKNLKQIFFEKPPSRPGEKALTFLALAEEEKLKQIPDIGLVATRSLREYFTCKNFILEIKKLFSLGLQITIPPKNIKNGPFSGKNLVITGRLPQPRAKVEEMIRLLGGQTQSAVSRNTDFLLSGEEDGISQKKKKALELNIPVLSWEVFKKKAGR